MWQGVGTCGRGGGRVWGHVAGGQAYGIDGACGRGGGMWQGVGACGSM